MQRLRYRGHGHDPSFCNYRLYTTGAAWLYSGGPVIERREGRVGRRDFGKARKGDIYLYICIGGPAVPVLRVGVMQPD